MKDRIHNLRKRLGLSQTAFGERIGLKKSAISKLESGAYELTDQSVLIICREFGVNMDWLRNGEGEMFQKSAANLGLKFSFRELTNHMLETFEQLCPEQQQAVLEYAQRVVSNLAAQDGGDKPRGSP